MSGHDVVCNEAADIAAPVTHVTQPTSSAAAREDSSYERYVREGKDKRWYYPWDKDICPMCVLMCMWFGVCVVFPCSLCITWCRNIVCCVDEGQWDNTCFGACICGIPIGRGRRRRVRHDSTDTYGSTVQT